MSQPCKYADLRMFPAGHEGGVGVVVGGTVVVVGAGVVVVGGSVVVSMGVVVRVVASCPPTANASARTSERRQTDRSRILSRGFKEDTIFIYHLPPAQQLRWAISSTTESSCSDAHDGAATATGSSGSMRSAL